MYIETIKLKNGKFRVRFSDNQTPFTRYKDFDDETTARHWVINNLQIEG